MTCNIVCIANDAYAQHAAVMLCSLFEANKDKRFRVFLLTDDISEDSSGRLRGLCEGYGSELVVIVEDVNKRVAGLSNATREKSWNSIMYMKLLLPRLLPEDVERCLFLDVDMVVCANVSPLYNLDLKGSVLAGCEDYLYSVGMRQEIGMVADDHYINSGVMVMDVKRWREKERGLSAMDFLLRHADAIRNDQDAFALYFKGEIEYLPTNRWNATTFFFQRYPRVLPKYYSEVEEVRQRPCIIHFCDPIKPWFRECKHPYRHLYRHYLEKTPWRGARLRSCKTVFGKPVWRYLVIYWLNRLGLRKDYWYEVSLGERVETGMIK